MIGSTEFKELAKAININIGENLLKTRKHPKIRFKVEISNKLKAFLQKKYGINGSFQKQAGFLKDADLITNNFYNKTDCHQIFKDSFEIKTTVNEKEITVITKIGDQLERKYFKKKPFVTIRFLRQNKLVLSQTELVFLNNFK